MQYNQSEQDYLECILNLSSAQQIVHRIDIAKQMKVSQAAVNKAVKLLCEKGYVYEEGKHLYLTGSGKTYAEKVYEKHCVLREFLIKLGVSKSQVEEDACKMEHTISDESFAAIKKSLNKLS